MCVCVTINAMFLAVMLERVDMKQGSRVGILAGRALRERQCTLEMRPGL